MTIHDRSSWDIGFLSRRAACPVVDGEMVALRRSVAAVASTIRRFTKRAVDCAGSAPAGAVASLLAHDIRREPLLAELLAEPRGQRFLARCSAACSWRRRRCGRRTPLGEPSCATDPLTEFSRALVTRRVVDLSVGDLPTLAVCTCTTVRPPARHGRARCGLGITRARRRVRHARIAPAPRRLRGSPAPAGRRGRRRSLRRHETEDG